MRDFQYLRPKSVTEAIDLMAEHSPGARWYAGGTDLLIQLRNHKLDLNYLIDIKGLPELRNEIAVSDDFVSIPAAATMSEIALNRTIQKFYPALVDAVSVIGSVQIRNRATIGGNICNASPAADTAPPLLVYGAQVKAQGKSGVRRIAINDFFVKSGETTLKDDELLLSIELPAPKARTGAAHVRRTRRRGHDLASVTLCCLIDESPLVKFAYGSVGPRPVLVEDKSGTLADQTSSEEAKNTIFESLFAGASPSKTSMRASPEYRVAMLRVLGERALDIAWRRLSGEEGR